MSRQTDEITSPFTLIPDLETIPKKTPAPTATTDTEPPQDRKRTADEAGLPERSARASKRSAAEAELEADQVSKRGKVAEEHNGNGAITLDDEDGAIMID